MTEWSLIILALVSLCLIFGIAFVASRRVNNYGFVDVVWSYSFAAVAAYSAFVGPGWFVRRALLASLVGLWSLRLGTHLCRRVLRHHPVEDGRYQKLRENWGERLAVKMAGFFQLQAISVALLAVPIWLACRDPYPHLRFTEIAAALLWALCLSGEALADAQLSRFSHQSDNKTKVCNVGLWHYSRHPNYFFEAMIWVAVFVFSVASPGGFWGVISPAIMSYLLLCVTGVPFAEEQSLRKRGEAYRHYQATTSAFVPWFPKSVPAPGSSSR